MERGYFTHPSAVVDEGAEIGQGTKIWHFTHIMPAARIGENCMIGQNVFIGSGVRQALKRYLAEFEGGASGAGCASLLRRTP